MERSSDGQIRALHLCLSSKLLLHELSCAPTASSARFADGKGKSGRTFLLTTDPPHCSSRSSGMVLRTVELLCTWSCISCIVHADGAVISSVANGKAFVNAASSPAPRTSDCCSFRLRRASYSRSLGHSASAHVGRLGSLVRPVMSCIVRLALSSGLDASRKRSPWATG